MSSWCLFTAAIIGIGVLACGEADQTDAEEGLPPAAPETTLYVDDDAAAGGDGSQERPFQTIVDAVAVVDTGMTIHVAPGHYPDPLRLSGQFEIAGSEQGVVVGGGGDSPAVRIDPDAEMALTRLQIHGLLADQANVELREVELEATKSPALDAIDSDVELHECSVTGTSGGVRLSGGVLLVADSSFYDLHGLAIEALAQANVVVEKSSFVDIVGVGASATQSDLTVTDSQFERITRDEESGDDVEVDGIGVEAHEGTAIIRNSVFRDIDAQGVWIDVGEGTISASRFERIGVTAVVFLGAESENGDDDGATLAKGALTDSAFADNGRDVFVRGYEAEVVDNTMTGSGQTSILVSTGAIATISRNIMTNLGAGAISLLRVGRSTVSANEVQLAADVCILVSASDAPVDVVDNVLESCASSAINLTDVTNVAVRGNAISKVTLDPLLGVLAEGISASDADLTIAQNEVVAALGLAISVARTSGTITDNDLSSCGMGGIMVTERTDPSLAITENRVEGNTGVGIIAIGAELDIHGNDFASTALGSDGFGDGIALVEGTIANVSDNTCSGNQANGLVIMGNVVATVNDNEFEDNSRYGVRIYCESEGVEPSQVDMGQNTYNGNNLGELADCE
jgi:Right handed beta helix region/Protein of unknown function (DUF1565)